MKKNEKGGQIFNELVFFLRFGFEPFIRNLLSTSIFNAYISKVNLNLLKELKGSNSSDKTLKLDLLTKIKVDHPSKKILTKHSYKYYKKINRITAINKLNP